jgi:NAD(P)-dependent dehydrogenase (short-subunit alcohol dehydrogenase family)
MGGYEQMIANAGIVVVGTILSLSTADMRRVLDINVLGASLTPLRVSRADARVRRRFPLLQVRRKADDRAGTRRTDCRCAPLVCSDRAPLTARRRLVARGQARCA